MSAEKSLKANVKTLYEKIATNEGLVENTDALISHTTGNIKKEFFQQKPEKDALCNSCYFLTLSNGREIAVSNIMLHKRLVRLGKFLDTGENVVIKIHYNIYPNFINSASDEMNFCEIKTLKKLGKFKGFFHEANNKISVSYIVQKIEYAGENDNLEIWLSNRNKNNISLSRTEKLRIWIAIINSIKSLHKLGISHNDIKLDNMIFNHNDFTIELVDFEHSKENCATFDGDIFGLEQLLQNKFIADDFFNQKKVCNCLGLVDDTGYILHDELLALLHEELTQENLKELHNEFSYASIGKKDPQYGNEVYHQTKKEVTDSMSPDKGNCQNHSKLKSF